MSQIQSCSDDDSRAAAMTLASSGQQQDGSVGHGELDGLLGAMAERDCQAAFNRLYVLTVGRVFGTVRRVLQDTAQAEEVVQEAYIKVWHHCSTFDRTRGTAEAWLTRIAHNHAVSNLRHRTARQDILVRVVEDDDPYEKLVCTRTGPEGFAIEAQRGRALRGSLQALPSQQRAVVLLSFYGELSHQDIATRLGWPLGTVKSLVRRGLLKMNSALLEHR